MGGGGGKGNGVASIICIALDVAQDGRVVLAERRGAVKVWDPVDSRIRTVGNLPVFSGPEDGILGLALHPGFATNGWVFLYHGTIGVLENRVSRFTLSGETLEPVSQKILLRVPTLIPKPNHSGGGMVFDAENPSVRQLPREFDGGTFLYEWERGWNQVAWFDAEDRLVGLKPVMPGTKFRRPICLQLGSDGAAYLIEWGSNWSDNRDAALVRLESGLR